MAQLAISPNILTKNDHDFRNRREEMTNFARIDHITNVIIPRRSFSHPLIYHQIIIIRINNLRSIEFI